MNKTNRITICLSILGLMVATLFYWYGANWINHLVKMDTAGFRSVWHPTMPPPMSISPIILLLLGFLFLGICGLRRKK